MRHFPMSEFRRVLGAFVLAFLMLLVCNAVRADPPANLPKIVAAPKTVTICHGTGCQTGTLVPDQEPGRECFMVQGECKGVVKAGWFYPWDGHAFAAGVSTGGCSCGPSCPAGGGCSNGECGQAGCQSGGCSSCGSGCSSCGRGRLFGRRR